MPTKRSILITLAMLLLPSSHEAVGQEFSLLGGAVKNADVHDSSYSWQLEYKESLGANFAAGFSYLNEGHVPNHHRDGHAIQLWGKTDILVHRLSLATGVGPYYYFDTTNNSGNSYSNEHGLGIIASVAATWYVKDWLFQLRTNWAGVGGSFDTVSTLAGIGYRLDTSPASPAIRSSTPNTDNEITAYLGQSIVNSFNSESNLASGVEYRRSLVQYIDWSVGWLYEGNNHLVRRNGITSELWGVRNFWGDRFSLSAGGGIYFTVDHYAGKISHKPLSGIITMSGSYRLHGPWGVRASWNRILTHYDRDADVLLGGISYCF
ncbi:hypothetical protein KI809_19890 [Geobacter pelophilus]|uniref:Uncharacterized protein n=1 Tax=Geoanaerobacter pelophilus TaxID=60036 RepID=A0AAW4LF85_9BACT|nr:hypothetical protein [Geoanaerobacter pelophilus]MBT0666577.1 hypothetical protein [Geoanaerobacter pelophilus]